MNIGDRKYSIESSEIWVVSPDLHLTVNIWTNNPKTYFIGEPVFVEESKKLMGNFEIGITNPIIDLMDSTILENDNDLHFKDLRIEFNSSKLTEISKVKINGLSRNNEELNIETETQFSGFEIWKLGSHMLFQKDFEKLLQEAGLNYNIEDDQVNGIIYLKIEYEGQ